MKAHQLRELEEKDLKTTLHDNYESLENFRFRHATGQLENYKSVSNTKKTIARIKTILKEKELNINEKLHQKNKK